MAHNQITTAICSILLLPLACPFIAAHEYYPSPPELKVDVVVEGMVYCQTCDHFGTGILTGAKPIPSAKISVTCKNHRKLVTFYKVYETDDKGYFYAQLDGFKMTNNLLDHPLQSCFVKPVYSPLASCSLLSNVNNGMYGSPLRYQKTLHGTHYAAVVYSTGPLAFQPNHCPTETNP